MLMTAYCRKKKQPKTSKQVVIKIFGEIGLKLLKEMSGFGNCILSMLNIYSLELLHSEEIFRKTDFLATRRLY